MKAALLFVYCVFLVIYVEATPLPPTIKATVELVFITISSSISEQNITGSTHVHVVLQTQNGLCRVGIIENGNGTLQYTCAQPGETYTFVSLLYTDTGYSDNTYTSITVPSFASMRVIVVDYTSCYSSVVCFDGDCATDGNCDTAVPTLKYYSVTPEETQFCEQDYEKTSHCIDMNTETYLQITESQTSSNTSAYTQYGTYSIINKDGTRDYLHMRCPNMQLPAAATVLHYHYFAGFVAIALYAFL